MEDGFCAKEMLRDLAIQSKRARMYEDQLAKHKQESAAKLAKVKDKLRATRD